MLSGGEPSTTKTARNRNQERVLCGIPLNWRGYGSQSWSPTQTVCVACVHQFQYWEPAKWMAKLRAFKTDANRLLLRTKMEAGHGGVSGRYKRYKETAFIYAFLLDLVPEQISVPARLARHYNE
jgi:uncharacterized membrane protein